jgi:hypothetical protein
MSEAATITNSTQTARDSRGRWLPGHCPNRNGRGRALPADVQQRCQEEGPATIDSLIAWRDSGDPKASIAASTLLLAYGFGRPPAAEDMPRGQLIDLTPEQHSRLTPQEAYDLMCRGALEPDARHPAFKRTAVAVIDAEAVAQPAGAVIASGGGTSPEAVPAADSGGALQEVQS